MLKKILPFTLCALLVSVLQAQEAYIFGVITDAKTNETLPGANVVADSANGTTTGMDGKYKLKLAPGNYRVKFSFLGYETIRRNVDLKDGAFKEINIQLELKSEQLDIVVVTSSQYEKNIAQETVPMEVLDAKLIESNNSRDLGEVISKTPGVQVQDGQVSIRGGSSYSYGVGSRTAVLVDGQTFLSADLSDAQLKLAPLEDVERVEVIKGASSVIYGSSALSGVVNLITGWPKTGEKTTKTTFYAGVYHPLSEADRWTRSVKGFSGMFFNHRQRTKHAQFMLGGNVDYIQSYLNKADEFRIRASFKTRFNPPKNNKINFGLNGIIMKEVSDRFFISQDLDSFAYVQGAGSHDEYIKTVIDPHFTYQDNKGNRLGLRFRYMNIFRQGAPKQDTLFNGLKENPPVDSFYIDYGTPDASSNVLSFDPQYQKNWNDRFILTTGIPVEYTTSRSNLYENRRNTIKSAIYVQGEFKYKKLSIVGGGRYEITKVDSFLETSKPVFRCGLNYQFGKATFVRASWGQGYRSASIVERYIAQEFTSGIYVLPNPDLAVETGWSIDLGLKQGIKIRSWKAFFDFSFFLSKYFEYVEYKFNLYSNFYPDGTKIIERETLPIVLGIKPFNVRDAQIFGWEASIVGEGEIGPVNIKTLAGYTYIYPGNLETDPSQKNFLTFLGNAFKYFPEYLDTDEEKQSILQFRQRHLFRGDVELTFKKISVGTSLFYNSFYESIDSLYAIAIETIESDNKRPPTLNQYIEDHKDGDFVADLRLGYELNDKIQLYLFIKNVGNKEYAIRPGKMDPPRTYSVQFRVKF